MLRFHYSLPQIAFNKDKFRSSVARTLQQALRNALREWYKMVWQAVPVYTGMARGSLVPMGKVLGNVPTSIVPRVAAVKVQASMQSHYDSEYKTLGAGMRAGELAYKLEGIQSGVFSDFGYEIEFNIPVYHWEINETNAIPFIPSSPWRALQYAEDQFQFTLRSENLPAKLAQCYRDAITVSLLRG